MDREDIKRVVDFQLGADQDNGAVADDGRCCADDQCGDGPDRSGRRRDGGEARNGARGDADKRWLLEADPFNQHPDERGCGGGCVGDEHGARGGGVSGDRRACIKAEPANPEHGRAEHDIARIVRWAQLAREMAAFAQHDGKDECGDTRCGVDDYAACKIGHTACREPAAAPNPMGHGRIDEDQPDRTENQHGGEFHTLDKRADHQRWRDDGKRHLEGKEQAFRQRATERVVRDTVEEGFA